MLRSAAVAAIASPPTALVNGRVFSGRVWPHAHADLPACRVYTDAEQISAIIGMADVQRTITLRVEVIAAGIEGAVDDDIDNACEEVESRLAVSLSVGGRSVRPVYQSTDIDMDRDGERVLARAVLTYRVDFYTRADAPGTLV
jgi:hypothetical protein